VLTGKYNNGNAKEAKDARLKSFMEHKASPRNLGIAATVAQVAQELGKTSSQVSLAWLRAQGADVLPIIGARKAAQLLDNLACLDVVLPPDAMRRLDEASRIDLGFPHSFLANGPLRDRLSAGVYDQIDKDRVVGLHPETAFH